LITTQKYNNFDQESLITELKNENTNNKYINNNNNENIPKNIMLNKNEVTSIKFYEFLVRNCVPETGILTKDTILTIENKDILNVAKIKLSVLRVKEILIFNRTIPLISEIQKREKHSKIMYQRSTTNHFFYLE
jgi:hypothetical protein